MNHLQKSVLATAVALACATPAHAAFNFLNNGVTPENVSGYTVNAGNFLFDNIATTATSPDRTSFQLLGQTTIANFGAGVTASGTNEYTLTMSIPMFGSLSATGETMNGTLDTTAGKTNFFTMYYGTAATGTSNPQQGTGFTDCAAICGGANILTGRVVAIVGFSITDNSEPGTTNAMLRLLDDRAGTFATSSVGQTNNSVRGFTHTAGSPGGGPAGQSVMTINAKGSATLIIEVDSTSANFFPGAPNFITANFEVAANPQFSAPYIDVAPSISYSEVQAATTPFFGTDTVGAFTPLYPGGANAGNPAVLGFPTHGGAPLPGSATLNAYRINNFRCLSNAAVDNAGPDGTPGTCDFATQGAGSGSFSGENIPEPNTMALLGLGLLGFGALSRRLRNKAA